MPRILAIACFSLLATFLLASVAVSEEPCNTESMPALNLATDEAQMTPAESTELRELIQAAAVALRAGGGDCKEAGESCTADSDCCQDLFCTDAANKYPNTCQALASPSEPFPGPGPSPTF